MLVQLLDQKWQVLAQQQKLQQVLRKQVLRKQVLAQLVLLAQKQALLLLQTPLALLPNQKTRCQIVQLAQNQLSA